MWATKTMFSDCGKSCLQEKTGQWEGVWCKGEARKMWHPWGGDICAVARRNQLPILGAKCSWLREVEMQRPRVSNETVYLRGRKKAMVPVLRWEEETGIRIKLELWAEARWEHRKALHWQVLSWKWLSLIYIFKKLTLKVIPPLWASVALSLRCS